jgi:beta-lactamase class A
MAGSATRMKSSLAELAGIIARSGAHVALAARQPDTGREYLIEPDASFHPASTMKICVMMEAHRQASRGLFTLDEKLPIKNEFVSLADGGPYSLLALDDSESDLYMRLGQSLSARELIFRMITLSSNLATNLLLERVGAENTTAFMRELGAPGLVVLRGVEDGRAFRLGLNNRASARALLQVLCRLQAGSVVSPQADAEMRAVLLQQQFNERIPSGLPPGVPVAHKTGSTGDCYHDAAIVYPAHAGPFALVILTQGCPGAPAANALIGALAGRVYAAWSGD